MTGCHLQHIENLLIFKKFQHQIRNLKRIIVVFVFISLILICSVQVRSEVKFSLDNANGKKIYTHYCTPCHGIKGDGKGFNAKNLDPRPANHTNIGLMNSRTDKELYDAISGGGRFVGKSTLMPPWGRTLNKSQIESLVLYLRKLCKCQGL
ncbi:MAG TPA: c-type cytochrome [Nitrospirae bacterium]|nr:c-type cytochrome [Nitrospirota bacterium]